MPLSGIFRRLYGKPYSKKALLFVAHFLNNYNLVGSYGLQKLVQGMLPRFQNVSDISNIQEIRKFQINPFYREYARALKVAKLIYAVSAMIYRQPKVTQTNCSLLLDRYALVVRAVCTEYA